MITFLTIILVILPALVMGLIEQFSVQHGLVIGAADFGPFTFRYHILLLLLGLLNCFAAGGWSALRLIAGWVLSEDIGFFLCNKFKPLNKDRWINFGMSGFTIPLINQWIPTTYVLLAVLFMIGILL